MALIDQYLKTVRKHTGLRATWPPGVPIAVGDVGRITDGTFIHVTSLATLGIAFDLAVDDAPADRFNFQSKGVQSVEVKAKGELNDRFKVVGKGKAGVRVAFSGADAIIVKTKDVTMNRIADLARLERELLTVVRPVLEDGITRPPLWQRDWVVVTEVVDAGAATVLASLADDAAIELEASANVGAVDLVDTEAGLVSKLSSSVGLEVIARQGLTPFYRAVRVKRKWWWLWEDRVVGAGNTPPADGDVGDLFEDPDTAGADGGTEDTSTSPSNE